MPSMAMFITPERSLINPAIDPKAIGVAFTKARKANEAKNIASKFYPLPLPYDSLKLTGPSSRRALMR